MLGYSSSSLTNASNMTSGDGRVYSKSYKNITTISSLESLPIIISKSSLVTILSTLYCYIPPLFLPSHAWRHVLAGTIAWPVYHEAQLQANISDLRMGCELQNKQALACLQGFGNSCLPQQHLVQPFDPSIFEVCVLRLKQKMGKLQFSIWHGTHTHCPLTHGLILLVGYHFETVG